MRASILVTGILVLIAVVGFTVFWGSPLSANHPVKEVHVTVDEGEVEFVHKNGNISNLSQGDRITADHQFVTKSTSEKNTQSLPIVQDDPKQSDSILEQETPVLYLIITDTEGNPFQAEKVSFKQLASPPRSITIGENGKGKLNPVDRNSAAITIEDERIFPFEKQTIQINKEMNIVNVMVWRKGSIHVKVVNEAGDAIKYATIALTPGNEHQDIDEADLDNRLSNDTGEAKFDPVVSGDYIIEVKASPYLPYEGIIRAGTEIVSQSIVLRNQCQIEVTVLDADSKPIAAAAVSVRSKKGGVISLTETCNEQGVTLINNLPPGEYTVLAKHPWYCDGGKGHTELQISKSEHKISLSLAKNQYSISGTVIDSETHEPVEGITVEAKNMEWPDNRSELPQSISGGLGQYTIEGLQAGTYLVGPGRNEGYVYLYLSDDNHTYGIPNPQKVTLGDNLQATGVDVTVYRNWAVTGRVVDKHGDPVENVHICSAVQFYSIDGSGSSGGSARSKTYTDEDGEYRYEGNRFVYTERCTVKIMGKHPVYKNTEMADVKPQPGKTITGVDFQYEQSAGSISGVVTDRRGRPVEGAYVLFWEGLDKKGMTQTQASGSFSINLLPGSYLSRVMRKGYLHADREIPLEIKEDETYENINFILDEGDESFEGWVSDETGTPLAGIKVILNNMIRSMSRSFIFTIAEAVPTGENGRFLLQAEYLHASDGFSISTDLHRNNEYEEVESHETTNWGEKNIHLILKKKEQEAYGNIAGRVQDENGEPAANFTVQLISNSYSKALPYEKTQPKAISNVLGQFLYEKLPVTAGPYMIAVKTDDSVMAFSDVIMLQENQTAGPIVITIPLTFTLSGRVVDQNGNPLYAARIIAVRIMEGLEWHQYRGTLPQTVSNEEGYFTLTGVPLSGGTIGVYRPAIINPSPIMLEGVMGGNNDDSGIGNYASSSGIAGIALYTSMHEGSDGTNTSASADLELTVSIGAPGERRDLGDIVLEMPEP